MKVNLNKLAKAVAAWLEVGKEEVSIAQIKEIIKETMLELSWAHSPSEILEAFERTQEKYED